MIACSVCNHEYSLFSSNQLTSSKPSNASQSSKNKTEKKELSANLYLLECCFSVVCKDCLQCGFTVSQKPGVASQKKQMCLSCLEPLRAYQPLDCERLNVLGSLLSSVNRAEKLQFASSLN